MYVTTQPTQLHPVMNSLVTISSVVVGWTGTITGAVAGQNTLVITAGGGNVGTALLSGLRVTFGYLGPNQEDAQISVVSAGAGSATVIVTLAHAHTTGADLNVYIDTTAQLCPPAAPVVMARMTINSGNWTYRDDGLAGAAVGHLYPAGTSVLLSVTDFTRANVAMATGTASGSVSVSYYYAPQY